MRQGTSPKNQRAMLLEKITSEGSAPDGPKEFAIQPKPNANTKWFVVGDTPGFPHVEGEKELAFPLSYQANFYMVATSKTDGKVKGRIWYEVVIQANEKGQSTTNVAKLIEADPAGPK